MNTTAILEFFQTEKIAFDKNVNLKTKTWIRRGGIAHLWVQPTKLSDFEKVIRWCQLNKIQFEVIGNTTNCYFLNDYNPELVISTLKLKGIKIGKDTITCDCGYNMSRLSKYCISHGIAGFEGFIGLPGTIGGATINNSGCFGSLISNIVQSVIIIINGEKQLLTNKQLSYRHRNSILKSNEIDAVVTSVIFCIKHKENPAILKKRSIEFQIRRKTIQEQIYPNLGSTFSTLEFTRLPFFLQCINAIANRLLNIVFKYPAKKQKFKTKFFLKLRGAGMFRKYVSEYGIGCFTWKDEGADDAFKEYVRFIRLNTIKSVIEIDVKGGETY